MMISQAIGYTNDSQSCVVMLNSKKFQISYLPLLSFWLLYFFDIPEKFSQFEHTLSFTLRGSESTDALDNTYYSNTFHKSFNCKLNKKKTAPIAPCSRSVHILLYKINTLRRKQ